MNKLIKQLNIRIKEADRPVGTKRPSFISLPPESHIYGLRCKQDKEGAGILTRSWKIHRSSSVSIPPQDFVRINKLAIKMNAANYKSFKDFRKNVDIKQKIKRGNIDRNIYLPHVDFVYGKPNRPPTPIKDVINNNYGNRAEIQIRNEYSNFLKMKSFSNSSMKNILIRNKKRLEEKKNQKIKKDNEKKEENLKPLYKLKMFMDVGSKVTESLKMFKSYRPFRKKLLKSITKPDLKEENKSKAIFSEDNKENKKENLVI